MYSTPLAAPYLEQFYAISNASSELMTIRGASMALPTVEAVHREPPLAQQKRIRRFHSSAVVCPSSWWRVQC